MATAPKKAFILLSVIALSFLLFLPKGASAMVQTVNVGSSSGTFNVPAGYTSVLITSGTINSNWLVDDRGPVFINGKQVAFQCSSYHHPACPDPIGTTGDYYKILGTNACNPATATNFPIDITSFVHSGANTASANVDNCGGGPSGWGFTIQITVPDAACKLSASETAVFSGSTVGLSWTAANTTSAIINGGAIPITLTSAQIAAGSGSITTLPITGNVTYTMAVSGNGNSGTCGPVTVGLLTPPTGGLVPCGRIADNLSTTDINESKPCDLCSAFYMLKKMLNFTMEISVGIAIFIIIIAGLLYAFSVGNPGNIEKAKSAITYAVTGLVIIFLAWLIVAIILNAMGYADITHWNQVNCNLQK